ncbi:MAG: TonB-dependent siderophore receptor [Cellvibrio sp.]|uniref:TonB-dependent siderophore receptor n=1 Tax=Cellvibrio sp. TaxID=1965322 RepID=UPI0031B37B2A
MRNPSRYFRLHFPIRPLTFAMSLALLGGLPTVAFAQPPTNAEQNQLLDFNLPAAPLSHSLLQIGRIAGVVITVNAELVKDKNSPAVQGKLTAEQALQRVLVGTGLELAKGDVGYTLRPIKNKGFLPSVRVSADKLGAITEGTGSYTSGVATTATGLALSPRETPQTVSVVTRAQIEDQGLFNLPAVLQQAPGINREQHDSERYTMFARGFEIGNYLVDGLPVSSYPSGAYGLLYQSQMDMVAFDRVEIVKGANGLMRGAGQPSASVNLIHKRPTRDTQVQLQGTLGSWDMQRLEGDVSGALNESASIRGRLAAAGENKDSFIDRYHRRNTTAFGVIEADLSQQTLLSVKANYFRNHVDDVPFGGAVPMFYSDGSRIDLPNTWSQVPEWANWDTKSSTLSADLEHSFNADWKARLAYNHQRSDSALEGIVWEGYVNQDGSGAFAWRDENLDESRRDALNINLSGQFLWRDLRHDLMFGLNRVDSKAIDDNYYDWDGYAPDDFFSEAAQLPQLTRTERVWENSVDAHVVETAGYAVARLRASEDLSFIVGTRLSNWSTDRIDIDRLEEPAPQTKSEYDHDNIASPYIGVVWDINQTFSLYTSYTDIFTPQSYRDYQGDLLGPIEGDAVEAGIKGEFFDQRLNATLAAFRIEQDNLGEDTGERLDGEPIYIGIEGAVATGIELELSGELHPGWQINGGISHHDIEDADGNAVLTASPTSSAKLFTTYRVPALNRLVLGGGIRWQDKTWKDKVGPNKDGIAGTPDDRLEQGSYSVLDLMASYDFTDAASLTLNINNLFDEEYLTAFRQGSQYGSPRQLNATFRYRF